jgi:adenine-specific DNA-methyltransferase
MTNAGRKGGSFDQLLDYLNGPVAKEWMEAHCQQAANGFLRLQNRVLRRLPVPTGVARERQGALAL